MRIIVFLSCLLFSANLFAQDISSKGKEFWLGFMDHTNTTQAEMDLYITSDSSTTGTVYIDGENWSKTFTVTANQVTIVRVPSTTAHVGCTDCIQDKGIRVVAGKPVAVYSHIHRNYRSDATLVLPTEATGKVYRVMGWEQESRSSGGERHRSQFMIIATSDDTKINITPTDVVSSAGVDKAANVTYSITLDKGEVYQGQAPNRYDDLTGTLIEVIDTGASASCKKIAVFSGNSGTRLGCGGGFSSIDNLYEQLYPVKSWGTEFCYVPLKDRAYDLLRVVAHQDNTALIINGSFIRLLNAGQFYESGQISSAQYITTNKPVSVAQFQSIQACGSGQGDPSMTIISPIQQTLKDIVVYSSEFERITDNYINVAMKTKDTSSFTIDGKKVAFKTFDKASFYSYAQIEVNKGFQQLKSGGDGFVAVAYGMGSFESYGYAAGANVKNLSAYIGLKNNSTKINVKNTLCLGEKAKFEGNANYEVKKWEWFFGDGKTSSLQNPEHEFNDTGTYRVKMLVTKKTSDGCSAVDSSFSEVVVVNNPTVLVTVDSVCDGVEVTYQDSVVTNHPEGLELKLWDLGDGTRVFGDGPKHTYDSAGKYGYSLSVRNKYECTAKFIDTIEIFPIPEAKFTVSNTCFKDSVLLVDSSIANPYPIAQRIWNMGEGSIDTVTSRSYRFLYDTSGDFTITLTAVTEKGCSSTKDTLFTKFKPYTLGFSAPDVCLKEEIAMQDTSDFGGATPLSRTWKVNDSAVSSDKTFNYKTSASGNFQVKLVLAQNSVCRDSLEKTVVVSPQLNLSESVSNTCFEDSTTLSVSSVPSIGSGGGYFWLMNGGNYSGQSVKHVFSDTGLNSVQVYSVSDNGCLDTLDFDVRILPKPTADFTSNTACQDDSLRLVNNSESFNRNFTQITWITPTLTSIGNPNTFNYLLSNQIREEITLVVVSSDGCNDSISKELVVYPRPNVTISGENVCLTETTNFTNLTTNDSGTIVNWFWDFDNGNNSTDSAVSQLYGNAQEYTAKLRAVNSEGCQDMDSTTVTVFALPVPNVNVINACLGEQTLLQNRSTISTGSIANVEYKLLNGTILTGPDASYAFPNVGKESFKMIVESNAGCKDSNDYEVEMFAIPAAEFSADETQGCQPFDASFSDNTVISQGNIVRWVWTTESQIFSGQKDPNYRYIQDGLKNVKLVVESDSGCLDSISKSAYIEVFPKPIASFSFNPLDPTIIDNKVDFTDNSANSVSWDWDFGDGNSSIDKNPSNTYVDTGLYPVKLLIMDNNNCEGDTTKWVFIEPAFSVFVPNAFTPNGDGLNETWGPEGVLQGVLDYEVQIFNRWGEILFESNDPMERWDGTYQGEKVAEGYYAYRMRYTDYGRSKWYNAKANIYLMR